MDFFSKDIKAFNDLFVHMLRDIYYAENQIVKATGSQSETGIRETFEDTAKSKLCASRESSGRIET